MSPDVSRSTTATCVLAIDAGGTYLKSILVGARGQTYGQSHFQTPSQSCGSKEQVIGAYRQVIANGVLHARTHGLDIRGVGIATPGPFDYAAGVSLMEHKYKSIRNVSIRDEIRALHLLSADLPIVFQQDVHSFLLGESWTGAAKGVHNVAAITIGTGLGFGVMANGVIQTNGRGGPHTVIFNRPFESGILEDRISRRGIIAQYRNYSGETCPELDVHDIALRAMQDSDALAQKVFFELGSILAEQISDTLKFLSISMVVFGGQISKSFDLFGPAFRDTLRRCGCAVTALPGANIEYSALIGVAHSI